MSSHLWGRLSACAPVFNRRSRVFYIGRADYKSAAGFKRLRKNSKTRSLAVAALCAAVDNKRPTQSRARQQAGAQDFFRSLFKPAPHRAGQGLVEATLVLLVFFALLIGVLDCGQVLYSHQALVARVEEAARWGSVHPFDGTGDQVANLILYSQPDEPRAATATFLGLTRANIVVRYQPPTAERPDDETISVAIVNYESHFFSPWIARTIVNPRPVLVTAPVAYRLTKTAN